MAIATPFVSAPSNASDALFRAWGLGISTALAAVGLTKVLDTGTIDFTTVTAPAGVSTFKGFEIWRFSDALQATNPIFMKIEYGSAGGSAQYPALRISFGNSTDGAGTLAGNVSILAIVQCSGVSATTSQSFCAGGNNWFTLSMWQGFGAADAMQVSVERTRDINGAETAEGLHFVASGSQTKSQYFLPANGGGVCNPAVSAATNWFCCMPYSGDGSYGGRIGVFPIFPFKQVPDYPGLGALAYFSGNISIGSTISVALYGSTNHVYMACGAISTSSINGNATAHGLCLRYE